MNNAVFLLLLAICLVAQAAFPTIGKKFYIGGNYKSVSQAGKLTTANNIASWGGAGPWVIFGSGANVGTDGYVWDVAIDTVYNVYVVGNFTTVTGAVTGPIARLKSGTTFESMGAKWGPGPNVVYGIATDCANKPSGLSANCDVYIGGQFTMLDANNNVFARNVAKFVAKDNKWEPFSDFPPGSALKANEIVTVLYKKESATSSSASFLWMGGNFGFKMYDVTANKWRTSSEVTWNNNGTITYFAYRANTIATDELYLNGNFNFPCSDGRNCSYVARYDYSTNKFYAVGVNGPNAPPAVCQLGDSDYLYCSGNFSSGAGNSHKFLTKINLANYNTGAWVQAIADNTKITKPINDFEVCKAKDPGCNTGSVGMVGVDGFVAFYDAKDNSYQFFGDGVVGGDVYVCKSLTAIVSSTASVTAFNIVLALVALLFMFM